MLKYLLPVALLTAALPATAQTSAFPDVSLPCYSVDASGYVVDLAPLCGGEVSSKETGIVSSTVSSEVAEVPVEGPMDFKSTMKAAGYRLALENRFYKDVNYDVWDSGEGHYMYFIWEHGTEGDRSNPQVVVEIEDPRSVVYNDAYAQGCYYSSGSRCNGDLLDSAQRMSPGDKETIQETLKAIPVTHQRMAGYTGSCMFPWQSASDGSQCGNRAALVRVGGS
ncbi:MAG TPA: hypothetical protein V6D29_01355 [Leptolyngbyaceae cyanobacterium]